jgi:hypothetical protein
MKIQKVEQIGRSTQGDQHPQPVRQITHESFDSDAYDRKLPPRGPVAVQRAERLDTLILGSASAVSYLAAGSVTVALVSNPVGWGIGVACLACGVCAVPVGLVMALSAKRPTLSDKNVAVRDVIAWLQTHNFLVDGRITRRLVYEQIEFRLCMRARSQFHWMEADCLKRLVQALNSCYAQGSDYGVVPNLSPIIYNILPHGDQE